MTVETFKPCGEGENTCNCKSQSECGYIPIHEFISKSTAMTAEDYHDHRKEVQERKARRRATETETLLSLREDGFEIRQLTEYHFRVNGMLDIFPTSKKWHNVKTNRRGRYGDVLDFVCTAFTPEI